MIECILRVYFNILDHDVFLESYVFVMNVKYGLGFRMNFNICKADNKGVRIPQNREGVSGMVTDSSEEN